MTVEDARENLPDWLYDCAFAEHYGIYGKYTDEVFNLVQRAYELLGNEEYQRIYDKTVKEACG